MHDYYMRCARPDTAASTNGKSPNGRLSKNKTPHNVF